MLEWLIHGNLCRTIGPLTLHSQEIKGIASGSSVQLSTTVILYMYNQQQVCFESSVNEGRTMCGRYVCPSGIPQIAVCVSAFGKWPGKKIPRGLFGLSLYAYLSAMLIHKSLNINTDRTCALIQNCKLWLVVEQSRHLKTQNHNCMVS